ncbi:DUF1642 domain-containing protein [Lactococcus cremoris]|uniref:DUF1642 domain-containing protein n=1 Tax=Lactococcus lactis subsp. cremoris TaxID=1359 RepID=UPI0011081C86|nr:DUF1642 domain-containing protein [Lactococcus cremoris]TLQ11777.1 DUF1642 domain-containing protein [Lactococcus cremoris]
MTKFEEEVKRPKKAYIDPFSKREVDFTGVAKKFTEGAQTLKEWKEYAFLLEDKLKLQQQALPVVPEDVAEWIEILKTKGLKPLKNPETYEETGFTEETLQDIVFWISEHQEDYMRAWLDGYTVEKPQLFEVKMPIVYWDDYASQLTNGFEFLRIDKETDETDFVIFLSNILSNTKKYTVHFTEQEIKSIDERYWQFAVPVEDGE